MERGLDKELLPMTVTLTYRGVSYTRVIRK